jgi:dTDP-N-acetylfucosamine:lipid II N-acetylfucosaminyltransferase
MNLHILADSKFSNTFNKNLDECGLLSKNKLVIRSNNHTLKYVDRGLPFAKLYSKEFDAIVGDTKDYKSVSIHQFSPLMYRWVAQRSFNQLNWMIWGADLYNLPFINHDFYEAVTLNYTRRQWRSSEVLYLLKLFATNMFWKNNAYAKVTNVMTWMKTEFDFAGDQIGSLRADHKFFFYENQIPYKQLDSIASQMQENKPIRIVIGNSGTASNNHIDAVRQIDANGLEADLFIPISYGDVNYIRFLRKNLSFYKRGKIEFLSSFMAFEEYIKFLASVDGLVMNNVRPQGYGNILMMMYLGKPVFLNERNISLSDLTDAGLQFFFLKNIAGIGKLQRIENRDKILHLLSHDKLQSCYNELFS